MTDLTKPSESPKVSAANPLTPFRKDPRDTKRISGRSHGGARLLLPGQYASHIETRIRICRAVAN